MKCSIHQPQFLPWLGYLAKIARSDVFVFLDNVQFKKNEFQNRNKIRIGDEAHWLTVPVSFQFGETLQQTRIGEDPHWRRKMRLTLEHNYGDTPHFKTYAPALLDMIDQPWTDLAALNQATVTWLLSSFAIHTPVLTCSTLSPFSSDPTGRLVEICRHVGADTYLSGSGGHDYLDLTQFQKAGITLEFQEFLHPSYEQWYHQKHKTFISHLAAADALFNIGGGKEVRQQLNLL